MEDRVIPAPEGLYALLEHIVDYAGLFPPAALPLEEAIQNYARYRRLPAAWMLGRFVCPAGRLGELARYADLFTEAPPFRLSVLATGAPHPAGFMETLEEDLRRIYRFHEQHPAGAAADVLEVRLPAALRLTDAGTVQTFLAEAAARIGASGLPRLDVFYEVPFDNAFRAAAPVVLEAIAAGRAGHMPGGAGLKIRCGGPSPADVPAPEQVAFALLACRAAGVRFKATAGLHHPVRHFDAHVGAMMHGFFNVFGAAVLADVHSLDEAAVRTILYEEDPSRFRFTPEGFAWQGLTASLEEIRHVRATRAVSFGSCSFEEPLEDLEALNLVQGSTLLERRAS